MGLAANETDVEFRFRDVVRVDCFMQKLFKSDSELAKSCVLQLLDQKLQALIQKKLLERPPRKVKERKPKLSAKEKVNKKRNFIRKVLAHQTHLSLKGVAKFTRSDWTTVKKVNDEMIVHGCLTPFEYNNIKPHEQLASVMETIESVQILEWLCQI